MCYLFPFRRPPPSSTSVLPLLKDSYRKELSLPCSTLLVPPKSKRLVQKYTVCMHAVYSKSIALQGQISLQAASSHATCSLVPLRKSNLVFGGVLVELSSVVHRSRVRLCRVPSVGRTCMTAFVRAWVRGTYCGAARQTRAVGAPGVREGAGG